MRMVLLLGVLVGCHGSGPASTGSAAATAPTCTAKLDELARFYDAVADDNAHAIPRVTDAAMEAGFDEVPEIAGTPAELGKADLLFVGAVGVVQIRASGEAQRLDLGGTIDRVGAPDATSRLVVEIDERAPWQRVEAVRRALGTTDPPYASIGVAYRVKHALAGRTPPHVPGAEPGHIDLPTIGDALAKMTAAHCPAYAKQLAAFQGGGSVEDPDRLRALGRTIEQCDCGVDTALLEVFPWLAAKPMVTVVPFATTAPDLHGAETATWGDLVRDAKGPIPMMLPPLPPPPPRPPPHRR